MFSKNKIKYIHSLNIKKKRDACNVFIAEGPKSVEDILRHQQAKTIIATEQWLQLHPQFQDKIEETICVTEDELHKVSLLQSPQQVMGIFEQIHPNITPSDILNKLAIGLDGIQDPGNLGTIIRIADWFGIDTILCSENTVDIYNPKVVQATMGSISRVKVMYTSLPKFIKQLPPTYPIYSTELDGTNIYNKELSATGLIIMGNEGNGISTEVRNLVKNKLLIPTYSKFDDKADSLNVAIATAVVCSEFRRCL